MFLCFPDSRSSESSGVSGHVVCAADDDQPDDASSCRNSRMYDQVHLNGTSQVTNCGEHLNGRCSGPKCDVNHPKLRSYIGKSMLPGLTGLHGLSSARHSAHSLDDASNASSQQCNNNTNTSCEVATTEDNNVLSTNSAAANKEEIAWVSRRLLAHRQLSSSDSWGSEEFESYSSNDEESVNRDSALSSTSANNNNESSMNSSKLSADSKVSADSEATMTSAGSGSSVG